MNKNKSNHTCLTCGRKTCDRQPEDTDPADCKNWKPSENITKKKWKPLYSGPGKSGICKCGHPWDQHHLGIVANIECLKQTKEEYVPQECEHYGCNELGGMMPDPKNKNGEWIYHCGGYEDAGIKTKKSKSKHEQKPEK